MCEHFLLKGTSDLWGYLLVKFKHRYLKYGFVCDKYILSFDYIFVG